MSAVHSCHDILFELRHARFVLAIVMEFDLLICCKFDEVIVAFITVERDNL